MIYLRKSFHHSLGSIRSTNPIRFPVAQVLLLFRFHLRCLCRLVVYLKVPKQLLRLNVCTWWWILVCNRLIHIRAYINEHKIIFFLIKNRKFYVIKHVQHLCITDGKEFNFIFFVFCFSYIKRSKADKINIGCYFGVMA